MRQNSLRIFVVAVAVASLAVVSAPRDAEAVSLNLINNWRMGNMGTLGNITGAGGVADYTYASGLAVGSAPDIGVNIHFGIGLGKGDQVVPFIGFNVDRISLEDTYDFDYQGSDNLDPTDAAFSMMVFGLEIGGKFFFIERAKGKAPPFLYISFYKYFASTDAFASTEIDDIAAASHPLTGQGYNNVGASNDTESYRAYNDARHSPLGFNMGFGAEYYFNDNFALGATFLGVSLSYAGATLDIGEILQNTTVTEFNLYTNLSMTYRFSFSVRASVQFESDYDYED